MCLIRMPVEGFVDERWDLSSGESWGFVFRSLVNELTAMLLASDWAVFFSLVVNPEIRQSMATHPCLEAWNRRQEPCTKDHATQTDLSWIKEEDEDCPLVTYETQTAQQILRYYYFQSVGEQQ